MAESVAVHTCYGGWSLENIRAFVRSLLGHVGALNPSEMFALARQAGALSDRASRPFVMALATGRFPVDELEKFAEGKPSLVDNFAGDSTLTLEVFDGRNEAEVSAPADPCALPAAPGATDEGDSVDVDGSGEVDAIAAAGVGSDDDEIPVVRTRDALAALDSVATADIDAETVKFLLDSAKAKLWRHAHIHPAEAREQAATFQGDVYSSLVRDRFLAEFDERSGYRARPRS